MDLYLVYLVSDQDANCGTAVFWCGRCLLGLLPMRTSVPRDGGRVLIGTETIPNYTIVPEPTDS